MSKLGDKLRELRKQFGLSQAAVGAGGFVSKPGWIKVENGQRSASDELVGNFVNWLAEQKHIRVTQKPALYTELIVCKYLDDPSDPVRTFAQFYAAKIPSLAHLVKGSPR